MTTMSYDRLAEMRTRRNNIHRYRRLLETRLTDLERDYIERRLAEEHAAFDRLMAFTLPMTFTIPAVPPDEPQAAAGAGRASSTRLNL
jgi:hypothetical protein